VSEKPCGMGVDKNLSMPQARLESLANVFQRSRISPARSNSKAQQSRVENFNDTQTGMPLGIPRGARCVQRFNDSRNSAIHITYRISLRSSSMREPRDPLLKVVFLFINKTFKDIQMVCVKQKKIHRPALCQRLSLHKVHRVWVRGQNIQRAHMHPRGGPAASPSVR
jgi:hypothetical protein